MKRILLVFILFFFYSCICDNETYYLNEDEIALFPYENENSRTFIDNNQDLVVFENIMYERDVYEESSSSGFIAFGPKCDDSFEEIQVSMRSSSYELYIGTGTDSVFEINFIDKSLGGFGVYYRLMAHQFISNYSYNDIIYDDVLRMYSDFSDDEVFLIKNIGVVIIRFGNQEFTLEN